MILLDLVGSGNSEHSAYDRNKYATLQGYEAGLGFVARRYCGLWGRGT